MPLIKALLNEHEEMKKVLREMIDSGFDPEKISKKLSLIRAMIQAHIKKEDTQLYPRLLEEHADGLVHAFQDKMGEIADMVFEFYDRYYGLEEFDKKQYSRDLGRLLGYLQQRLRKEEHFLYPQYSRLIAD